MTGTGITRRQFVAWTGKSVTLAALALPMTAQACLTSLPPSGATAATSGRLVLPEQVPFEGPTPDLPGNAQGLDAGYFNFPADLVRSVSTPPGDGTTVTAI